MSYKDVSYVQVQCDFPGCEVNTDFLCGGEFSAYANHGWALDDWFNNFGTENKEGLHFCADHSPDDEEDEDE